MGYSRQAPRRRDAQIRPRRRLQQQYATGLLLVMCAAVLVAAGCGSSGVKGGSEKAAKLQTIRFQKPTDNGPSPFTQPADVSGPKTVSYPPSGSGPFGGTGSNQVCDRDLLIRFLKDHPDRMRAWAEVEGIDPSYDSVSKYIAKLHPVTLTRDTPVTNHTFINGQAVGFQAILQAGTAVLVDQYGRPVARCRCGNPLTEPHYSSTSTCEDCPPHYTPPSDTYCRFWYHLTDYDHNTYTNSYYSNKDYDKTWIEFWKHGPWMKCYEAYPDPPPVTLFEIYSKPKPQQSTPAPLYTPPSNPNPQPYQHQPYNGTTGGGTTGGGTTGGGTTGGGTTGGGTTGGGTTGGGTTGGGTTGGGTTGTGP